MLGLGDVYLGAPVATPLDPRHRLVTTKYNPARTWTPENAVGIGGAYLCIYGMEGPGGYQFVGRTTQVWSRYADTAPFEPGSPWLLRFFDRISWYPVSPEELLDLRADMAAGRGRGVDIDDGTFSLAEHEQFLADNADPSRRSGPGRPRPSPSNGRPGPPPASSTAPTRRRRHRAAGRRGGRSGRRTRVEAPFAASVWKVDVAPGDQVVHGPAAAGAGGDEDGDRPGSAVRRRGAARSCRPPAPRWWRASRWWSSAADAELETDIEDTNWKRAAV